MGRKQSENKVLMMNRVYDTLLAGALERREIVKTCGVSSDVFEQFITDMTFQYPIYEYIKNNKNFYGAVRNWNDITYEAFRRETKKEESTVYMVTELQTNKTRYFKTLKDITSVYAVTEARVLHCIKTGMKWKTLVFDEV